MEIKDIIILAVGLIIGIGAIIYLIVNEKTKIIEWLKYAVAEAEKQLGGKTGELKLHKVYDWFCGKFKIIAVLLPFKVFSAWVNVALDTLKDWLDINNKISDYIVGDNNNDNDQSN